MNRRAVLGSIAVLTGALAGCAGDGSDGGPDDQAATWIEDGVVDYDGLTDGAGSVSETGQNLRYEEPETTFAAERIYEGRRASDDQLRFGPDLTGDVPAAFVAPTHDGEFTYHVFANDGFYELAEWRIVELVLDGIEDTGAAIFDSVSDGVWHTTANLGEEAAGIAVLDQVPDTDESGQVALTGVALANQSPQGDGPYAPAVSFEFEHEGDVLTIIHEAGDTVSANTLVVSIDDERIEGAFGDGEVTAGDRATIDMGAFPDADSVRVVWEAEDTSQTLDEHHLP